MKKTYSLIFVAAACAAVLISIAVVTPKAVRAAVATLIRDQDNAARHPFVFETGCLQTLVCIPITNLIPNQEYVIQNVSVSVLGNGFPLRWISVPSATSAINPYRSSTPTFRISSWRNSLSHRQPIATVPVRST